MVWCCIFSCFSASQIREFVSRRSVGRKNAKIWAFSKCTERQAFNRPSTFKRLRKHRNPVAKEPLSHCERASIATPQRLSRNAARPQSQRDRAFIANPKCKNEEKKWILNFQLHVFSLSPSLFSAFESTLFCWDIYECIMFYSSSIHTTFKMNLTSITVISSPTANPSLDGGRDFSSNRRKYKHNRIIHNVTSRDIRYLCSR